MKKIVMKFGGTSVADGERIRHVANLVADHVDLDYKVVVVISALKGITDRLLEASHQVKKGDGEYILKFKQEVIQRHSTAIKRAIEDQALRGEVDRKIRKLIEELGKVLTGIIYLGELTSKSKDYILSFGERLSAPIVSGALKDLGVNSQHFTGKEIGITTDSHFGEATPLMKVTKHQVNNNLGTIDRNLVPVVTGFMAATPDGEITTLGRGGSDYTATILGAALEVDEVWIWTDVDGLMTCDPQIVPTAKTIEEISFQEATEMAVFGAKAMHPKALQPAMEANIPVRIRNTFNPENPGTLIIQEQKIKPGDIVKAIALVKDVALINVSGAGMIGAPGTAAKVFHLLGKENINILMISQSVSEANISLLVPRNLLERAVAKLEIALLGRGLIQEVNTEDDICVVAVVGAGMKGTPGVASRVFTAMAQKGINVRMIAQGSSELNISFIVTDKRGKEAVQAIHKEFQLNRDWE
ncbi:MAG: aspartate kinase [Thermoproteota archaeon]